MSLTDACFIPFQGPIAALPARFTQPFHYEPHPLCLLAVEAVQTQLRSRTDLHHDFGLTANPAKEAMGKMFGVLVVENIEGTIGYIAAFSGKLGGKNHHKGFVPPVFDILEDYDFYRKGEDALSAINRLIETLENAPEQASLQQLLQEEEAAAAAALETTRQQLQAAKQQRHEQRARALASELPALEATLTEASKRDHFIWKDLKKHWQHRVAVRRAAADEVEAEILRLKEARKTQSAALQQKIFEQYTFLNQAGATKSLSDIFQGHIAGAPPAGAGECAAPKLLQYAFLNRLRPVAMAEFWWGASPVGEIRKHGHFYPACRGKCEPILAHMLDGMTLDDLPTQGPVVGSGLDILYEDDDLLVLNKPAGLLAVPGKSQRDSVYWRVRQQYPDATGPLIVHRLDMATSGLMLVAKTDAAYHALQQQFIKHRIQKRYVAVLDGNLTDAEGVIDLPLRVDLDDRPRQMVCYEYGKSARTLWRVVARENGRTRVHFFPVTGRTHQLRVHAAHPKGLNMPITGDDLYGQKADRLHLHAEHLVFEHPGTGKTMEIEVAAGF